MKTCIKCGAQNPDINNFCSACGYKFESQVVSQPIYQPTYQQTQQSSQCQITFNRPSNIQWPFNKFHVMIDNAVTYELSNGGAVTIPVSQGHHEVKISVFGIPKSTKFNFMATGDMTFICKPNIAANLTFLAKGVKVTDSNGREY